MKRVCRCTCVAGVYLGWELSRSTVCSHWHQHHWILASRVTLLQCSAFLKSDNGRHNDRSLHQGVTENTQKERSDKIDTTGHVMSEGESLYRGTVRVIVLA
jgi:hypothetical protein